ncbi:MAG: MAPEG family protein [Gammaproteobacteria bacterium]|nr:MAPEG family protein [Gammaproteobacteria bacterium]
MPITMFYTGCLSLVLLSLAAKVISTRGTTGINVGDGGDERLIRVMRGQANFIEYVPICLLMLGALELSGLGAVWLHVFGAALLLGRLMHGYAFALSEHSPIGRLGGIVLTLSVLGFESLFCVSIAATELFLK